VGLIRRRARTLIRQRVRKPVRRGARRAVTRWCPECQRNVRPFHACVTATDFKARKARQLREQKRARAKACRAEQRRRRREREKARRAKAAAARKAKAAKQRAEAKARAKRPAAPRQPVHRWQNCRDPECTRYACVAYRQGVEDCPRSHEGE